ncbi:MAG: hypothetical protein U9R21_01095 [Candidatus Thermoplasmatota archaeon]|nr:hypothetical protein [Candidatus Thermoplasmatota archaeon]
MRKIFILEHHFILLMLVEENQVQLSDFFDLPKGIPLSGDALWKKFKEQKLRIDQKGVVKITSPFCPYCGMRDYSLNGTSLKLASDILGERFYFVCQRYQCMHCEKPFSAYVKHIVVYDEEMVHERIIARVDDKVGMIVSRQKELYDLGEDIVSLLNDVLHDHIDLQMSSQTHYSKGDIMDLVVRNSVNTDFMESTRNLLDIGPQFVKYPSADTVLLYVGRKKLAEIRFEFRIIFQNLIQKYHECGLLSGPVDVAVDLHDERYYGKQLTGEVIKGKAKNGTNYFHKYLTVDCVGTDMSFTLTGEHVSVFDDRFQICNNSLDFIRGNNVQIRRQYFDREFFNRKVIDHLLSEEYEGTEFVMPAVKNKKVMRLASEKWDQDAYVFPYHFGEGKKKSKEFTIFIIPNPTYDPSKKTTGKNPEFYVFATNISIKKTDYRKDTMKDNSRVPGNERKELAEYYTSRWGIETDYRVIHHEFLGKTTSNKFNMRYLNFMTSVVLRNAWKLSQILFKDSYQDKFPKNTLTAKAWAKVLERAQEKNNIVHSLRLWDDNTIKNKIPIII